MPGSVLVSDGDVWLGDVKLDFEFTPGTPMQVPEPIPILLMGMGLLAIALGRHKLNVN